MTIELFERNTLLSPDRVFEYLLTAQSNGSSSKVYFAPSMGSAAGVRP